MAGHALRVDHLVVDSALVQAAIAVGHLHVVLVVVLLLLLGEMCVMLLMVLTVLLMWPLEREREMGDGGRETVRVSV